MPRRDGSIFETLVDLPWWASVVVASLAFIVVRFVIPSMMGGSILLTAAVRQLSSYAVWIGLFFLIPGALSALRAWRRGGLLKGQKSIGAIRDLSWRSLEDLVGEAYRQEQYSVMGNIGPGADGGVDLIARKGGETTLVQCKHWKARRVGVGTVREMFGLLNAERANEVHIVSSGYFTQEAKDFARGKPITLIDGPMLVHMVNRAQYERKDV